MATATKKTPPSPPPVKTAAPRRRPRADEPLDRFDFQQDSLGYALRRAQMHAYALFFEMIGPLELSPARLTALSMIAMESDINQATLARRLDVAGPSVMKMIDALQDAGYIQRLEVVGDRRRYSLALTPAGRTLLDTLKVRMAAYETRLASTLSPAERQQLLGLLSRVVGAG